MQRYVPEYAVAHAESSPGSTHGAHTPDLQRPLLTPFWHAVFTPTHPPASAASPAPSPGASAARSTGASTTKLSPAVVSGMSTTSTVASSPESGAGGAMVTSSVPHP